MDISVTQNLLATLSKCSEACLSIDIEQLNPALKTKSKRLTELLKDCIELCNITESFVKRESLHYKKMLKLCTEICFKTAEELLKFGGVEFTKCYDICRICAVECANAT